MTSRRRGPRSSMDMPRLQGFGLQRKHRRHASAARLRADAEHAAVALDTLAHVRQADAAVPAQLEALHVEAAAVVGDAQRDLVILAFEPDVDPLRLCML